MSAAATLDGLREAWIDAIADTGAHLLDCRDCKPAAPCPAGLALVDRELAAYSNLQRARGGAR